MPQLKHNPDLRANGERRGSKISKEHAPKKQKVTSQKPRREKTWKKMSRVGRPSEMNKKDEQARADDGGEALIPYLPAAPGSCQSDSGKTTMG